MSWSQGVQLREELPAKFVKWADGLGKGEIEYITWFGEEPNKLHLDYGEKGSFSLDLTGTPFAPR